MDAFPEMADVGPDQGRNVTGPHAVLVAQLVGQVFNAAVVGVGVAEVGRVVLDRKRWAWCERMSRNL